MAGRVVLASRSVRCGFVARRGAHFEAASQMLWRCNAVEQHVGADEARLDGASLLNVVFYRRGLRLTTQRVQRSGGYGSLATDLGLRIRATDQSYGVGLWLPAGVARRPQSVRGWRQASRHLAVDPPRSGFVARPGSHLLPEGYGVATL